MGGDGNGEAWGAGVASLRIGERSLLVSLHGQGAHDSHPAEGCPACVLVQGGEPLLCDECRKPNVTVGTCADCLFKRFEVE